MFEASDTRFHQRREPRASPKFLPMRHLLSKNEQLARANVLVSISTTASSSTPCTVSGGETRHLLRAALAIEPKLAVFWTNGFKP